MSKALYRIRSHPGYCYVQEGENAKISIKQETGFFVDHCPHVDHDPSLLRRYLSDKEPTDDPCPSCQIGNLTNRSALYNYFVGPIHGNDPAKRKTSEPDPVPTSKNVKYEKEESLTTESTKCKKEEPFSDRINRLRFDLNVDMSEQFIMESNPESMGKVSTEKKMQILHRAERNELDRLKNLKDRIEEISYLAEDYEVYKIMFEKYKIENTSLSIKTFKYNRLEKHLHHVVLYRSVPLIKKIVDSIPISSSQSDEDYFNLIELIHDEAYLKMADTEYRAENPTITPTTVHCWTALELVQMCFDTGEQLDSPQFNQLWSTKAKNNQIRINLFYQIFAHNMRYITFKNYEENERTNKANVYVETNIFDFWKIYQSLLHFVTYNKSIAFYREGTESGYEYRIKFVNDFTTQVIMGELLSNFLKMEKENYNTDDTGIGGCGLAIYGRIGFDIQYVPAKWAKKFIPEEPNLNLYPIIAEDAGYRHRYANLDFAETIIYDICGMGSKETREFITQIKQASTEFDNIYESDINMKWIVPEYLTLFLKNPCVSVGSIAWGLHARVIYKDDHSKTVRILDPWKQSPDLDYTVAKQIKDNGYEYIETARKMPDQPSHEGSCQVQALMRMLMISRLGWEVGSTLSYDKGANPEILDYIVVTHSVVKKITDGNVDYKYKRHK